MKKRKIVIIIAIVLCFVFNGIDNQVFSIQSGNLSNSSCVIKKTDSEREKLEKISLETMKAIQKKDLKKLSTLIDQKKGLMISMSPYIEKNNYVKLTPKTLLNLNSGKNKKVKTNWGIGDGTGEPILLTFEEFHKKFLWPANYLGKGIEKKYNDIPQRSNSNQNYKKVFKTGVFIEYHFKGTEKYANLDWNSIILIYEKANNKLCLSGIIIEHWRI